MAVLLEDVVKALEMWLKLITKSGDEQAFVDPNLDPVLLVPGIAGSILNAVDDETGAVQRVWVRILGADHEFCSKLWSRFDPSTGRTVSLNTDCHIEVPEDRYGLYAIDVLDPDLIIGRDAVYYFHDMIVEMQRWGYQEGTTLFGFGYDFRQSNRLSDTLDRLAAKLEMVYNASGGKKINVISHSMGGLLVKCFMSLRTDIFEKYVKSWIAIAAPFRGAPGYVTSTMLNGMTFVEGWEQNFFIKKWSFHQMLIECPSLYELMACRDFEWQHVPLLEIWREMSDSSGNTTSILASYPPTDAVSIIVEALNINKITYGGTEIPLPFNVEILKWANETRNVLNSAKVPDSVKFYNIYGSGLDTPHSVCYGSADSPISDLHQLPKCTVMQLMISELVLIYATYICVDGDGTVPLESAKADGLEAVARVCVPGEHRGILCDRHVFRVLKHWLRADHDPFYNPLNDYVILPTSFDIARHQEKGLEVTSLKEEWEIVADDDLADDQDNMTDGKPLVSSISVSRVGQDKSSREEAYATIVVQPQSQGKNHVELSAMSVSSSA